MSWRWNVGFGIDIPWNRYGYIGVAGCSKYIGRYANMSRQLSEYGCSSARWHLDFDGPVIDSFFREALAGAAFFFSFSEDSNDGNSSSSSRPIS